MAVNREKPHVLVLPEDDADRAIANGFALVLDQNQARQFQVLPIARGWSHVVEETLSTYVDKIKTNRNTHLVLLIDFDNDTGRLRRIQDRIPAEVAGNVYVLGAAKDPEAVKRYTGKTFEGIGIALAEACRDQTPGLWGHPDIKANEAERVRLNDKVRSILFG